MRSKFDSEREAHSNFEYQLQKRTLEALSEIVGFQIILKNGVDSVRGRPNEIFEEFDRRTFTELSFIGEFRYERHEEELRVSVESMPEFSRGAIEVKVTSSDSGWANKALAMLSEEIDKGASRLSWVHHFLARWLLGFVIAVATGAALYFTIPAFVTSENQAVIQTIAILLPSFLICGTRTVYYSIFPRIEISETDGPSRGTKSVFYIIGIFVTVVLGILVNRIS
jgi:hypothetical protein